ncbi:hypothetical protein BHS07_11810 [Myxococcus xanthus]|nr:hypothetical protein BHS07_11810 [Myxococcus xanthus]
MLRVARVLLAPAAVRRLRWWLLWLLLLLLLRLPLAVLLQLLRREEDLDLLAVRSRLHPVGLAVRGEEDLRATATAPTAAAAAGGLAGLPGGATLCATCAGITVVGPLVVALVATVIVRLGRRHGAGGGNRGGITWVAVIGVFAHESSRLCAPRAAAPGGGRGRKVTQAVGQEADAGPW